MIISISDKIFISDHQTILLKLLDSKIHAYNSNDNKFPEFISSQESLDFLIQQFQSVATETITVVTSVKNSQGENKDSELEVEEVSNIYTAIILLLQMINALFVLDEDHARGIKDLLVGVNALSLVTGKKQNKMQHLKLSFSLFSFFTELCVCIIRYFGAFRTN
jgi:ataxin-10